MFVPAYGHSFYGGKNAQNQGDMDAIYEAVRERFPGADIHRLPSLEAAGLFESGTFDVVYIDGDHTYEAVKADLAGVGAPSEAGWGSLR